MEIKTEKLRSNRQSAALHLMFRQLADELNNSGLTVMKTLKQETEIMWNEVMIKELIWRPIQKAMTGKSSTTAISTADINKIFEVIAKYMAEKHSLIINFPSIETMLIQKRSNLMK